MSIKVKLRKKEISGDRKSLYLDFYPPIINPETGKTTRREFLKMYLLNSPKTQIDKLHNKDTLALAELIRQKRENRLNKPEIYSTLEQEKIKQEEIGKQNFLEYFSKQSRKKKGTTYDKWIIAEKFLKKFIQSDHLAFKDIDVKFCNDYKDFLLETKSLTRNQIISPNTSHGYFNKFKATLRQAFKDGLFTVNISDKVDNIKMIESKKEFLSLEELNQLAETDCKQPVIKQVALFSALTGLRVSDIQNLTWKNIIEVAPNEFCIHFQQKKTQGIEVLPIPEQVFSIIGSPKHQDTQVFQGFVYSAHKNKILKEWIREAGITKKITFHCFRHTYATLQLTNGTDLYTVSKMLGHKNISTTQIYAKIVDEKKREATNKIKINFPSNKKP